MKEVTATDAELDNLLAESKGSQAYIINSQGDTLVVPAGKKVLFNPNTEVVVVNSPAWLYDYSWAYRPWYFRDYYWYGPWYWDPWYNDYAFWYSRWNYRFYAPWSFWYDPYRYPWYNYTWFGPYGHAPFYCGGYYYGGYYYGGAGGHLHGYSITKQVAYAGSPRALGGASRSTGRSIMSR